MVSVHLTCKSECLGSAEERVSKASKTKNGGLMQILVVFRRRTERFSADQFAPMVESEVETARALYQDGFIRQIWHRGDEPGAILLLEADDLDTAKLARLPMYEAGMLEIVLISRLKPYAGFGPTKKISQSQ
jgi:muconolactone delta-isomerase